MKNWEDIVKERLEGYESALPEGGLAEFRARREAGGTPSRNKAPRWAWGIAAPAAAALATLIFLRQPETHQEGSLTAMVTEPVLAGSSPVSAVDIVEETDTQSAMIHGSSNSAHESKVKAQRRMDAVPQEQASSNEEKPADGKDMSLESLTERRSENEASEETGRDSYTAADAPPVTAPGEKEAGSPFIPEANKYKEVNIKVLPAAGGLAGAGLLSALVAEATGMKADAAEFMASDPTYTQSPGTGQPKDDKVSSISHSMPLKLGLSAGLPVNDRLRVTTGLDYSLYNSRITYTVSGEKSQRASYIAIPVRLDWTAVSGRLFDIYAGAGLEGELCVDVTLGGKKLDKDGASLSLIGVGGIQMNVSRRFGLYVEPGLSWRIPGQNQVLKTYRSDSPLMFSVGAGMRVNISK